MIIFFFILAKRKLNALVDRVVSNRINLRKDTDHALFVDVLLDSTDDKEVIGNDAMSFIIAGFHTTGNSNISRKHIPCIMVHEEFSTFDIRSLFF